MPHAGSDKKWQKDVKETAHKEVKISPCRPQLSLTHTINIRTTGSCDFTKGDSALALVYTCGGLGSPGWVGVGVGEGLGRVHCGGSQTTLLVGVGALWLWAGPELGRVGSVELPLLCPPVGHPGGSVVGLPLGACVGRTLWMWLWVGSGYFCVLLLVLAWVRPAAVSGFSITGGALCFVGSLGALVTRIRTLLFALGYRVVFSLTHQLARTSNDKFTSTHTHTHTHTQWTVV